MQKNFLKKIRNQNGLTLQELSDLTGKLNDKKKVSPQSISNYENFKANLGKEALNLVAKALKVTIEQITTIGVNQFTSADQTILLESMTLANKSYPDLSQEEIVGIATQIFKLNHDYSTALDNNKEEDFENILKEQLTNGLAAKAFLNKIIPSKKYVK